MHEDVEKETCKKHVAMLEEKLKYLTADFENYRRNVEKDRSRWTQTAQANVLTGIVSLVDDYERALADLDSEGLPEEFVARFKGFELIFQTLTKLLDTHNVKAMNNYDTFDPLYHEAVMQVVSEEKPAGSIVQVLQKGYLFNDTVLRPGKVSIAQ